MFHSINPFTEEKFNEISPLSDQELEKKLCLSVRVFTSWNRCHLDKKIIFVQNLRTLLDRGKQELASLITREMGKPLRQSIAEIEKCARLCEYVVKQAPFFLRDETEPAFSPENSYVTYRALGVILGIMPWNFPFWQVFRFALPTLLGGNIVVIKHAPNVMLCATGLEKLFVAAGFPVGVYQNFPVSIEQTTKLIKDSRIKGVSLTGSVKAGRAVAALAGQYLKKSVLELGGSDPYLIMDSANLEQAAEECVLSRMNNGGQSCIAAKRLIVTGKNTEAFVSLIKEKMKSYKMGDPMLPDITLGPLARLDLRDHLHTQVKNLVDRGAQVLLGARLPEKKGYFYPPTIMIGSVSSAISSFEEELFGPVALVIIVSDEKEAIQTANASPYGLGAAIFSQDIEKAEQWARNSLQTGSCSINRALHSHPALPFGGIKNSGYGRELSSWGFYEFVNIKTVFAREQ